MGSPSLSHPSDQPVDPRDEIYGVPAGANRSLGELIAPDDWRLYQLMRELPDEDRVRIIAFAELLSDLRQAREAARRRGG
ncbi:MAG TPA: hypothetical protein VKB09_17030 [Thermomicrobiales bacterium]|nr:hypothetical protein [Thermomicrobiales bacterium]